MSSTDKNIVINKKRPRSEDTFEEDGPPSKKSKITIEDPTKEETIEALIGQSSLIHQLNIPIIVHKEIASYAQGNVKYCSNEQCDQVICVFNDDDTNLSDIRYKACVSALQIFCIDCMEFAIPAVVMPTHSTYTSCGCDETERQESEEDCRGPCCHRLEFIPDCPKCDFCHESMPTRCKCTHFKCHKCGSKSCSNCDVDHYVCTSCHHGICANCKQDTDTISCVCINCYDDTVIQCNQCNVSYPLLYAENKYLQSNILLGRKMQKCKHLGCVVFVCLECEDNPRHKYCYIGPAGNCTGNIGPFCSQHIPQNGNCCKHRSQTFWAQPQLSYERALQILLNEGHCIDAYDFKTGRWRTVKYNRHWKETKKIMISYVEQDVASDAPAYSILEFPNMCVWHPLEDSSYYNFDVSDTCRPWKRSIAPITGITKT